MRRRWSSRTAGPTSYDVPAMDRLYRNNGDGTFTGITFDAGINVAFGNGLGTVGADFNGDGLPDLFVANDTMVNQLWVNQGNLRFEEDCVAWSCAVDVHGIEKAGMGGATADVDDDGDSDLLVVNLERQTDSFFRNEGSYFFDATQRVGIGPTSMRHTRFGVVLADFDNDGRLDLYEANGKVALSEPAEGDGYAEPNSLYRGSIEDREIRFDEIDPPWRCLARPDPHQPWTRGWRCRRRRRLGSRRRESRRRSVFVDQSCETGQLVAVQRPCGHRSRCLRRHGLRDGRRAADEPLRATVDKLSGFQRSPGPLRARHRVAGAERRRALARR